MLKGLEFRVYGLVLIVPKVCIKTCRLVQTGVYRV